MGMARSSQGEVLTGTTIIACSYDGGVVLGADSRTSSGSYVANKAADKITKVCDQVYLCRSGSAAHTQAVAGYANLYLNQHAIELGQKGCSVRSAANIVCEISYSNKAWMNAGMIIAVVDRNWRPNMTKDECKAFVRKAVSLAISRDGSSGGVIRTVTVNKDEQTKEFVPGNEVAVYQDEIQSKGPPKVEFVM